MRKVTTDCGVLIALSRRRREEMGAVRVEGEEGEGGEGIRGALLRGEGRRCEGVRVWLGFSLHYIRYERDQSRRFCDERSAMVGPFWAETDLDRFLYCVTFFFFFFSFIVLL
jgi:hypothetical protein